MTVASFDRLSPGAGQAYFDVFADVAGFPSISATGTVTDGSAVTLTGTGFSASGNTVFVTQNGQTLELAVTSEGTTSITTEAIDASGLYLTQSIAIYVIDALDQQSPAITATLHPASGEAAYAVTQEFLGDASTRASAAPDDIALGDEIRIRNIVGGTTSDIAATGQGALSAAAAVTAFDHAVFDGTILGPYATTTWASPSVTGVVPDVSGMTQTQAELAAVAAGYTASVVASVNSATVAIGLVIGQFPDAGSSLAPGGVIELTLSLGTSGVLVPRFIGSPRAIAESDREAAGLTGSTLRYVDGLASDVVLNQSVAAGTPVEAGSAVDLVVSSALAPNVVGLLQQQAEATLLAANLTLDTSGYTDAYNPSFAVGTVIAQSPAADTPVAAGQAFRLVLSVGSGVIVPASQVSSSSGSKPAGYDSKLAAARAAAASIRTRR